MSWTLPVKTEHMKNEAKYKVNVDYAENIYKVASRLKDFTALEIGAAWGFSALAILGAGAKFLVSVDNNELAKAKSETEANGYTNHEWNKVRSEQYWRENETRFDLIYVDGSHSYGDVKMDLYQGWERLNKNGLLLADDWDHRKNNVGEDNHAEYGVSLACFQFWRDHIDEISNVGIEGRVLWFEKCVP